MNRQLLTQLNDSFSQLTEQIVPEFIDSMPPGYFQDIDEATQLEHIKAIVATGASNTPVALELHSPDSSIWTYIARGGDPGTLLTHQLARLPKGGTLTAAKVYISRDAQYTLTIYHFTEQDTFDENNPLHQQALEKTLAFVAQSNGIYNPDVITKYMKYLPAEHLIAIPPSRICHHSTLLNAIRGTSDTNLSLQSVSQRSDLKRIAIAVANTDTRETMERIVSRLHALDLNIAGIYLDTLRDETGECFSIISYLVHDAEDNIQEHSRLWFNIKRQLRHARWLDKSVLDLLERYPNHDLYELESLAGLCSLIHQKLSKENQWAYTKDSILRTACYYMSRTETLLSLILRRFNPESPLPDEEFIPSLWAFRKLCDQLPAAGNGRIVLQTLADAVESIRYTNLYVKQRYALAFNVDPKFLDNDKRPELPYGVFFVHGREFNGFHVRFRDIARGGVRVVIPRSQEQHTLESERHYDENYGLAFAQQLKNKDIPEGGSKGVILMEPLDASRVNPANRCVKAYINSLLDMITPDIITTSQIAFHPSTQELLYLGPDENITNELIEWIVKRAEERNYPCASAFMSSKPGAGINHKEFGVTSEGVIVYLDVALHALGYEPRNKDFTVKLTGGPDGDVGGNAIRILNREYGEHARIVGIADGSGCLEDPDGLNHAELLRLVNDGLPVMSFSQEAFGPQTELFDASTENGAYKRNSMHNRVLSDAFLPCGGRPSTINEGNWEQFLTEDETPSSRLIVEGANLFLTEDARQALFAKGTIIVKDSSANKAGVICSSYEIGASMLLDRDDFLALKEVFVADVLQKLRHLARCEATLLFNEYKKQPERALSETSVHISKSINKVSDAITAHISTLTSRDELQAMIYKHLPDTLIEAVGEHIHDLPDSYAQWMISASLASHIVYHEGLDFIDSLDDGRIGQLAVQYLSEEGNVARYITAIEQSDLADREKIIAILRRGGTRSALGL